MEEISFSLVMLAYNHEKYIAQAIESILCQKTDVNYEIIIGEDASQDNTREIVRKYQLLYPNIIKPVYNKYNIGATKNLYHLIGKANGKYIAFIDGDDYWCVEDRIEKDIVFLENHKEYIGISHQCKMVDREGSELGNNTDKKTICNLPDGSIFTLDDFKKWKMPGHFSCQTIRNFFPNIDYRIIYQASDIIGDRTIAMLTALQGNVYRDSKVVSCYRYCNSKDDNNFTSQFANRNWRDKEVFTMTRIEKWLNKKRNVYIDLGEMKKNLLAASVTVWMKNLTRNNLQVILRIVRYSGAPLRYFYYVIKTIILKLFYWYILKEDIRIKL